MTRQADHPPLRRLIAALLVAVLELGPVATPAYAALTPLADQPLNITTSAKPNIVMTVDDSTSMLFDYLPDYVVQSSPVPYCRGGTGAATAGCGLNGAASDFTSVGGGKYFSPGYVFEQYNMPYGAYVSGYDVSGPGAGCHPGAPPTCSPGVNPGPLPGIATYPPGPQPTWPNANKPYEYWLFWPAPAHNAAMNALYYDPLITYEPPVDFAGVSYAQMNAGNTLNWTKVPADPWASPVVYVDLTAKVNLGLWCNSDWTIGFSNNTDYCRVNGSNAAAFSSVPAVDGQDYLYPWAPGDKTQGAFTVATYAGGTTATTYAAQKVTLNASLAGTAPKPLWGTPGSPGIAQDPKFFYENENVIWCDPTHPSWPQTGPTSPQTCNNLVAQTCSAFAGACINKTAGACNNVPTCGGLVVGACTGAFPAQCNGSAGVCNGVVAATCTGAQCLGSSAQTCNGTNQSCNTKSQTCSGPFPQVCNLPGTQTCAAPVCKVTYSPPGCELLPPDPENVCTPVTSCAPPVCTPNPGKCSVSGASCTSNAQCPTIAGACSLNGAACMQPSDCGPVGQCSIDSKICAAASDCAVIGGACSKTGQACTNSAQCPASGNCKNGGAVCLVNSDCPGNCNNAPFATCQTAATCPVASGLCSDGTTACTTSAQCPLTGGTCSVGTCSKTGTQCTKQADCGGGGNVCNFNACTASGSCPSITGTCDNASGTKKGNACMTNASCLTSGICSNTGLTCSTATACGNGLCTDGSTACQKNGDCPNAGKCNSNGAACNNDNQCPPTGGVCSLTNQACTTPGVDAVNCPPVGKCSITGAQCTSNASCPSQPGPLPPSAAVCSTGGVAGVPTATLRNDAENNGVVCRRNNKTSGAYTSGRFDYPSGKFLTPITYGTGADACTMTDHWQTVPRHYWKVSVEWCDQQISVVGDRWNKYGTPVNGSCQAFKDSTHIYPRFFQYGAAAGTDNVGTAAFTRVDLDIAKRATAIYDHGFDALGNAVVRNFDQEMTNYANWFAYYRTRIQAVKTVTSLTFTDVDAGFRVGLHTLSNGVATKYGADLSKFVNIADFDATQKKIWFNELFAINIPLAQETPNLDAMTRIGDWFATGTSGKLAGATDPIVLSCQKNWHMLFTDGFTNQSGVPKTLVGDQDDLVPAVIPVGQAAPGIAVPGLTPGKAWPGPYRQDPKATASDAASDYAMNYWVTDLRTSGAQATDNVPTSLVDPASWQHLNFAALSLGTQGKLPVGNQSLTESQIASGALQWPQPYPNVYRPDNSGVDDLWHAAINGRGRFVNADSADELKLGMGQILQDLMNNAGARAGAGFAGTTLSATNHVVYRARFEPGWGGSLTKIEVDPKTGVLGTIDWEASTQLAAQLQVTAGSPTPWLTNRRIVTMDDSGKVVPFLWGNLSLAQQDSLAPGKPARGQKILDFLRGDATNEGSKLGQLRVRSKGLAGENFLGDIVNASPVYVGAPNWPYLDGWDPGYSTFKSANATRAGTVYVAANDGMFHAFDDATGNERWAYIPHDLYRAPTQGGLGALAYQDGALPPFRHHYYVDSTPRVVDVDLSGGTGADWRSLLVGGLGKGGKSYYAIDVTSPSAVTDETTATSQVLWEFRNADLGYTYGRPFITKTHASGWGWVVVVPSGYNNASGVGKIFFIDAKTGTLLKTMSTGFGSPGSPSGLAHVSGYTKDFHNQLVEQIYGGDLYGHFWRFDVSDADPNNWTVVELATLTDAGGAPQPVTTPPQIEIDLVNGVDRWVFVGTGRLLDITDLTDAKIADQQQTLYAIRDGTGASPLPFTATLNPRTDPVPFDAITNKTAGLSAKPVKGWYDDLPVGQRIVTPVQATYSMVAYLGTSAQDDPCLTGQPATLYVREFGQGNSLLTDSGGAIVAGILIPEGGVGLEIVNFAENSSDPTSPDLRIATTAGTTGLPAFVKPKLPLVVTAHRMSWRLIGQ